jgi:hypothetical protein
VKNKYFRFSVSIFTAFAMFGGFVISATSFYTEAAFASSGSSETQDKSCQSCKAIEKLVQKYSGLKFHDSEARAMGYELIGPTHNYFRAFSKKIAQQKYNEQEFEALFVLAVVSLPYDEEQAVVSFLTDFANRNKDAWNDLRQMLIKLQDGCNRTGFVEAIERSYCSHSNYKWILDTRKNCSRNSEFDYLKCVSLKK